MFSLTELFLFLTGLLPLILLFYLYRSWKSEKKRLGLELYHMEQALLSAEEVVREVLKSKTRELNGNTAINSHYPLEIPGNSELIYAVVDFGGRITKMNPFTRDLVGYSELENSGLLYTDLFQGRQKARLLVQVRNKNESQSGKMFPFFFLNRFGEKLRLLICIIPDQDNIRVTGCLMEKYSGFGTNRYLPAFESALHQSAWPAILLEKKGASIHARKNSILWTSASAGSLPGFETRRVTGLPLEAVSAKLASLIFRRKSESDQAPVWEPMPQSGKAFYVIIHSDASFMFVQLLPATLFRAGLSQKTKSETVRENSFTMNFDRFLEITDGDPGFMKDLLPTYLSALRECRMQFRLGLSNSDPEKIRFLHHKIKATIRTFEIEDLEEIFRQAMEHVAAGKPEEHADNVLLMARLNTVCAEAEKEILNFARQNNLYF